ncbi:methyl-accepting chemotaxis protein [Oceanobacter kriegii]|uniref:methyl-accepting chemotaxis protein n=1 Tax=Oceanobacter kriegii TaxID=64972 RepID=UPI0004096CCE|nr:methyl-accepting chemotaxis protein [Oceanobacter kriegii]
MSQQNTVPRSASKNILFLKVSIASALCLGVLMGITLWISIKTSVAAIEEEIERDIRMAAYEKRHQLDAIFKSLKNQAIATTNVPSVVGLAEEYDLMGEVHEGTQQNVRDYLGKIHQSTEGVYENIFITNGRLIIADGIGGLSEDYIFEESNPITAQLLSDVPHMEDTMISPITDRPIIFHTSPITDRFTGKLIGSLGMPIDLANASQEALGSLDEGVITLLLNKDGVVFASNREDMILSLDFTKQESSAKFFADSLKQENGIGLLELEGNLYKASFAHLVAGELTLVFALPKQLYLETIHHLQNTLLLVGVIGTITATLLISAALYFITRPLLGRLSYAMETARNIADGKLNNRIRVTGNDEGSQLLQALDDMQNGLGATIAQIASSTNRISNNATRLSELAGNMSDGVHNQQAAISESVEAVTSIGTAFLQMQAATVKAAEASRTGDEESQRSKAKVAESIDAMQSLNQLLDSTSTKMSTLASDISNIHGVLDVIRSIAEQTNLLALNAAIEAARAGESGRGFAVVADEVRSLAKRTEESTTQITQIIYKIIEGTEQAVEAMKESTSNANLVLEIGQESGKTLDIITDLMHQISYGNQQIATLTNEQTVAIQNIDINLNSILNETAKGQQGSEMNQQSSRELGLLAQALDQAVGYFDLSTIDNLDSADELAPEQNSQQNSGQNADTAKNTATNSTLTAQNSMSAAIPVTAAATTAGLNSIETSPAQSEPEADLRAQAVSATAPVSPSAQPDKNYNQDEDITLF